MRKHPVAITRARQLGCNTTPAEHKLWFHLKNRSLAGHKFVRQRPIGPYIVDFACRSNLLVVEVDGSQHAESARDARRDRFLASLGYRVLRFWNHEVLANVESVLETIFAAADERTPHPPSAPDQGPDCDPDLDAGSGDLSSQAGRGIDQRPRLTIAPPSPLGAIPLPACGERSVRAKREASEGR